MQATACITGSYYASIPCRFGIRPDAYNACEFAAAKEIVVTSQTCNLPPSQEYKGCWSGGEFGRVTCSLLFLDTKGQPVYLLLLKTMLKLTEQMIRTRAVTLL